MKVKLSAKVSRSKSDKYRLREDWRSLGEKDLRKLVGKVRDIVHKRVTRLQSEGIISPALQALMKSGGEISTKGADLKQLQRDYVRAVNFLNMETSKLPGAKAYENNLQRKFGGRKLTDTQKQLLFTALRVLEQDHSAKIQIYGSDTLIQELAEEITAEGSNIMDGVGSQDWDAMIQRETDKLVKEYEAKQDELYATMTDVFSW